MLPEPVSTFTVGPPPRSEAARTEDTTLRRQKNSRDTVIVSNPDAIPPDLRRYELKIAGNLLDEVDMRQKGGAPGREPKIDLFHARFR
jgi:hypothetical protein